MRTNRRVFNRAIFIYKLLYQLYYWTTYYQFQDLQEKLQIKQAIKAYKQVGVWNIDIHEKDHDICTVTDRGMKRWYHSASSLIADLRLYCKVSAYKSKATVAIASLPSTGWPPWACWIADFTFKDDNPDAYLAFVMCIRSYQHYIHDRKKWNEMSKESTWLNSSG